MFSGMLCFKSYWDYRHSVSFNSGEVPEGSVSLYPAAFMHVHFVLFPALPVSTPAFIQPWRLQSLQSGEMISQLLTDLLSSLEAALGGLWIEYNLRVYGILYNFKPE